MKKTARLALMIAVTLGAAQTAHAADYLVRVPVDLKDIPPQLNSLVVFCLVKRTGTTVNLGVGEKPVTVSSGIFLGLVEVDISRNNNNPGSIPDRWACGMRLKGDVAGAQRTWTSNNVDVAGFRYSTSIDNPPRPSNVADFLPIKAGTTPATLLEGPLPP